MGADAGNGGISGVHVRTQSSHFVAPATPKELNRFRAGLFPVACWRLNDVRFDFDSSFVLPAAVTELALLAGLVRDHPKAPLSIFGHADTVGSESYNKKLSGRRATAIFAALVRDVDKWAELFDKPFEGDAWGVRSVQRMLDALLFDPGPATGVQTAKTTQAIKDFQTTRGLAVDGDAGHDTRRALFADYMDFLCTPAFKLTSDDFLARGAGRDGKGDIQGCSEFNPVVRLSAALEESFKAASKKQDRDAANAPNRRVVAYLFAPGSRVDPEKWPCPSVSDGNDGCRKRFWSDHDRRATATEVDRHYEDTEDTFQCRFYDRMARKSPCEALQPIIVKTWVRIFVRDAKTNQPVSDVSLVVTSAAGETFPVTTDASGGVLVEGLTPGLVQVSSAPDPASDASTVVFAGMGPGPVDVKSVADPGFRLDQRDLTGVKAPRHIAALKRDSFDTVGATKAKQAFVQTGTTAAAPPNAQPEHIEPFQQAGLATEAEHEIHVSPLEQLTVVLKDEHDFAIPLVDFEVTMADRSVHVGTLDMQGRGVVFNPVEGPYEVRYPNLDDVKAKSLAGRVRKACSSADASEIYQVLLYSPALNEAASVAYGQFFNDLSGQGMAEDIQRSINDPNALLSIQLLMQRAGLPVREKA